MRGAIAHVELELGPGPEHPFGERGYGYHLYLPLGRDNRLDLPGLRSGNPRYRVRRQRPGEKDDYGSLLLDTDGRLLFNINCRASNRQVGFHTPPDQFVVGHSVAIAEEDGETRSFQVIAVRREWPIAEVP